MIREGLDAGPECVMDSLDVSAQLRGPAERRRGSCWQCISASNGERRTSPTLMSLAEILAEALAIAGEVGGSKSRKLHERLTTPGEEGRGTGKSSAWLGGVQLPAQVSTKRK